MTETSFSFALSPATGTPLHRQVFLLLREQILRGKFAPGSTLPKEEALCEQYGVSRITVRRALSTLAAQGLVESRQGRATFVRSDLPAARQRPSLSFLDELRRTVVETDVEVLGVSEAEPPAEVAELLALEPGSKAVHAIRLRSIAGTPVMLTDAWVPLHFGKRVTAAALRRKPLYEILIAGGVELRRVVQEITATVADPMRAQALQTEVGGSLLKIVRVLHGSDQRPVEYLEVYLRPDRSRILMDIDAAEVNTLVAGRVVHDGV